MNFGFWGTVALPADRADGYYNRLIEDEVSKLDGHKSLYSTAFYPEDEFYRRYNGEAYRALKRAYDGRGAPARPVREVCQGTLRRPVNGRNAQDGTSRGLRGIRGARRPGGVHGLRRQSRRPGRISGEDHGPLPGRRGLPGPGPRGARAGPGLRGRPAGRRGRHVRGPVPDDEGPVHQPEPGREAAAAAGPGRAEAAAAPDAAAAPGGPGAPALAGRTAALQGPRRQRDLAPLRRLQPVLRVGARAEHGLYLRLLPARGRDPGRGAGRQVRPGRAQAGAARGHAAAGRGLRLGRHGDARRAGVRRQGARRHAVRAAGRLGPGRHRA